MIGRNLRALTIAAAIGAATCGGVFFAFSTFVMKALKQLPDREGIAAMQAINRAAPNPLFMAALFGTAAASVGLGVVALRRRDDPASTYVVIGSALYLAGIVLTVAYHVPHNDALALVDSSNPSSAGAWHSYLTNWTAWNHVRTLTSMAGAIAFTLAINAD